MDISIAKLLTTVYELEGLLLVVNKHGDDTPAEVIEALKSKAQAVDALARQVSIPSAAAPSEPAEEPAESETEAATAEEVTEEAIVQTPKEAPVEAVPLHTAPVVEEVEESIQEKEIETPQPQPEETAVASHDTAMEEEEDTAVDDDDDDELPDDGFDDDDDSQDEEDSTDEGDALSVEEKVQRSKSKDLRRAFSINDRYRFRRELFGNSNIEMSDAINMVMCMHSLDEAEDYFYGDLNWEKTSPEVKDFMEIIKNHFA